MKEEKNFLTFAQQIDYLKNKKHIIIPDIQEAQNVLQRIGYFPLMGGYKQLFRIPLIKKYKPETSFNEIVALYQFDADLRAMFLKYLFQVERHIGTLISYYFTQLHGISQKEYLNPINYDNNKRNQATVHVLIKKLYGAVTTTEYEHINYYRDQYNNIPLWVTVNVLTFGSLSRMYKVLPQSLRAKICKHFNSVNQKQLERSLSVLTKYRNVCAHNDRLYNFKTVDQILNTPLHARLAIPQQGNQYIYGKQDLFSVVIIFRYLLPDQEFIDFARQLSSRINKFQTEVVHITKNELLRQMGFPPNWETIIYGSY